MVTSKLEAQVVTHLVSNKMLAWVWARLRDSLSAVDSSLHMVLSLVHVTKDYADLFYDMYVNKREGKHLTGDRVCCSWLGSAALG